MPDILIDTTAAPGAPGTGAARIYVDSTKKRISTKDENGVIVNYPMRIAAASVAAVAGAFATDTYLAGSGITVPLAGDWTAGETYRCVFDMEKTAAGTAAFTITVRMGTLGTTADAAILTLAFAAGTAAADQGRFVVEVTFRTVGSGTSAVIVGVATCSHHLAATGLVSTGASGTGIIKGTSAGFNSTTQTVIGLSVNGGTSFSGTCELVQAEVAKAA